MYDMMNKREAVIDVLKKILKEKDGYIYSKGLTTITVTHLYNDTHVYIKLDNSLVQFSNVNISPNRKGLMTSIIYGIRNESLIEKAVVSGLITAPMRMLCSKLKLQYAYGDEVPTYIIK